MTSWFFPRSTNNAADDEGDEQPQQGTVEAAHSQSPDLPEVVSGNVAQSVSSIGRRGSPSLTASVTNYQSMRDQYADLVHSWPASSYSRYSPSRYNNNNTNASSTTNRRRPSPMTASGAVESSPFHNNNAAAPTHNYRGFSTSIGDMFAHPHQERVDCCAMTCCGIFQSDRDRYLLRGVPPPSPWKRVCLHLCLPVVLFLMAGYAALHIISDIVLNEFFCLVFLVMLAGIIVQCQKGRAKRLEIRKDVLWYKYQLVQHRHDDLSLNQIFDQPRPDDEDGTYYYRGQTAWDVGSSHPLCFLVGCYPADRPGPAALLSSSGDQNEVEDSLCSCLYQSCCRPWCGMYVQLGGICGMAQESREIESHLLPAAYRRLDYVTMQPMLTYFEDVYNRRWRQFNTLNTSRPRAMGPLEDFPPPLSSLSRTILLAWAALTVFLGIWSLVGPLVWTQFLKGQGRRHYFSIWDYFVYMASWIVCLGTLAVVVYLTQHKKKTLELSADAMIKYFCCGFVLSSILAIFYEIFLTVLMELIMLVFMAFSGIDLVEDNNNESMADWAKQSFLTIGFGGGGGGGGGGITAAAADGEDLLSVFGRDFPAVYTIYLFIKSYFLASLVEEICKYFGYRMMEHPDFLDRQDLEDAARAGVLGDHDGGGEENGVVRRVSFPHHGESLGARGAAITVAMVCVALGFSMSENLVYIFLKYGSSFEMELHVLMARTLFPIHPIAAALQSIGVVERDVEKCPTQFGRILLPAVIFHGTYDFLLFWINFLASLTRQDEYNDVGNSDEALDVGGYALILSHFVSFFLMAVTLFWFYRESKRQQERLAARDLDPPETNPIT